MAVFNAFYFDGVSSLQMGLKIENKTILNGPEPILEEYSIPGRTLPYYMQDGYSPVVVSYNTFLKVGDPSDFPLNAGAIKGWLQKDPTKFYRLEDDYDLDHYRKAAYQGGVDFETGWKRFARLPINFTCDPYRYLRNGDQRVTASSTSSIELYNPTSFEALPEIVVFYGSFNGTGIINIEYEDGTSYNGSFVGMATSGYAFLIDSEEQIFRNGDTDDSPIYPGAQLDIFPVLKPGKNTVSINISGASQWGVRPRWREL